MEKLEALKEIIVRMMVEVLGIFAIMMKDMKRGRASESTPDDTSSATDRGLEKLFKRFLRNLIGRKDRIEAALNRMDGLTSQEVATAIAQIRNAVNRVDQGVESLNKRGENIEAKVNQNIEGTFARQLLTNLKPMYYD